MTLQIKKIFKIVGYLFAGLVILFALTVSVARLLTPYLNQHLPDFESWSSQLLETPVKLGNVHISWNYLEPEIAFDKVTLFDKKNHQAKMVIKQIKVNLSLFRSFFAWKPLPEAIKITGVQLTITQPASGEFRIEEFDSLALTDDSMQSPMNIREILAIIFSQPNLILKDIDVNYKPLKGPPMSITFNQLSLENSRQNHHLIGNAILNQEYPTDATIDLEWNGNVIDFPHVSGKMFLYVQGVSLSQWLQEMTWHNIKVKDGLGSAKIWAIWNHDLLQEIQAQLQFYDSEVEFLKTHEVQTIERFIGKINWKRVGTKQYFTGDDILIDFPNQYWPTIRFEAMLNQEGSSTILEDLTISHLNLTPAKKIVLASHLLPDSQQALLLKLDPMGEIRNFHLRIPKEFWNACSPILILRNPAEDANCQSFISKLTALQIDTQFDRLGISPFDTYPGIKNASGSLNWDSKVGYLKLTSEDFSVLYRALFPQPIRFDQLTGLLRWWKSGEDWTFAIKKLQASNSDLKATLDGLFIFPSHDSVKVEITSDFNVSKAEHISKYLPLNTFGPELSNWLKHAFIDGEIQSAEAVLKGRLSDFPFSTGQGTFLIKGIVKDLDLNYAPNWPMLNGLNGSLVFSGPKMQVDIHSGSLLNGQITSVKAVIPQIGGPEGTVVLVDGDLKTDLANGLAFIHQSPLEKKLGEDLAAVRLKGPMDLKIFLTIPLKNTDETKVEGKINLNDSTLDLSTWDLKLDQLKGQVNFTENAISSTPLQGVLFDKPAVLVLSTDHPTVTSSIVKAQLASQLDASQLEKWVKMPVSNIVQGITGFTVDLSLSSKTESKPTHALLKTNLSGIKIDLPEPYGKKAEELRDLELNISFPQEKLFAKVNYGNLISAALGFKQSNQALKFESGEVKLGSGEVSLPRQSGLVVSAQFEKLNWEMLQHYMNFLQKKSGNPSLEIKLGEGIFREVKLDAKEVNLFGQLFTQAHVDVTKSGNSWIANIDSNEIAGKVAITTNFSQIQGNFQRFFVKSATGTKKLINPEKLPALSITANDVRFDDKRLGRVVINTAPVQKGLQINDLQIASPVFEIRASGFWQQIKNQYSSQMRGQFYTRNISQMLGAFGLNASSLIGSSASMGFDFTWPDAPYSPSLAGLTGILSLQFGPGRIVNLSPTQEGSMGIGRLLNLFSLQSIPRRLTLDFSDIFQNGYTFDSLRGNFRLDNGNAYTSDTYFDGPVARIEVSGRIGMGAKNYDLILGVTPYVTSTLPVVAGIAAGVAPPVGVAIGVASWMMSKSAGNPMSKLVTYRYKINGSWDKPEWREAR